MSNLNDPKLLKAASKFMSLILRHAPKLADITLDNEGWVPVDQLLIGMNRKGIALTREDLDFVVANNDKSRFAFDASGTRIRASQGHTLKVDLKFEPRTPPDVLYHGTHAVAVSAIQREGLRKMKRQHVHLSKAIDAAMVVGSRRGTPIIFAVDAKGMEAKGFVFYQSENAVWLTDEVPPAFLKILSD